MKSDIQMFRKTRKKIVFLIMGVSILLLAGIILIISLASAREVQQRNLSLLEHYAQKYTEIQKTSTWLEERPLKEAEPLEEMAQKPVRLFELSTFYSVFYDLQTRQTTIDNKNPSLYSDAQLLSFSDAILADGKETGVFENFYYLVQTMQEGELVVLLDNTIENDTAWTILKNTLIFGSAALLVILVLSWQLSGLLLKPVERSDQKQRQFVSDAGHELKTPLAAIKTNLEMISRSSGKNRWVENIEYEIQRMSGLIHDLILLSRTESRTLEWEPVDLSRCVWKECLCLEVTAFEKGHPLQYEGVESDLHVAGSETELAQLACILIDNALEHSNKEGPIKVELHPQKNKVLLEVSNPALPIPSEEMSHLFDRFYRRDGARSTETGHYGLGLSIARAIVSSHKGQIQALCENGQVIFRVLLPACPKGKDS